MANKNLASDPVVWSFRQVGLIKVNTNGAAKGSPNLAACDGIFRGNM